MSTDFEMPPVVPVNAPDFVKEVTAAMIAREGDLLPVSAFPDDGTWPVGTTQWEKRNLAIETPQWIPDLCIQCNKCALVLSRMLVSGLRPMNRRNVGKRARRSFQAMDYKGKEFGEAKYTVQVSHEDCTGCNLCVSVCPGVDKQNPERRSLYMEPHDYFTPEADKAELGILSRPSRGRSRQTPRQRQNVAIRPAPLRVFGGLFGLRRDTRISSS